MGSVNMGNFPKEIIKSATKPPAAVIGIPIKLPEKEVTLNRANLKAPHITKTKEIAKPQYSQWDNCKAYAKIAGATPKDTRSARESNSFPKSEETLSFLATLPSK